MIVQKKNVFLLINLGLIIVGIAVISLVDRTTASNNAQGDIRARAANANHLKANATVVSTDPIKGMMTVTDLYFTNDSRSGEAQNLGMWTVVTPAAFNFSTVQSGSGVVIGIDTTVFNVSNHTLTASSITPQK